METCLVLSARRYDFKDDSGKQVDGVTVAYVTDYVEDQPELRGCQPLSITAPSNVWAQLGQLPGYYDLDFKQRPGPKGKPMLQLVSARFVEPWEAVNHVVPKSA